MYKKTPALGRGFEILVVMNHFTVMVTFLETTGGSWAKWIQSPSTSWSVCLPGGNSSVTSVWPPPKCRMFSAGNEWQIEVGQLVHVDQQVMMAGVFLIDGGRGDAHSLEAKPNCEFFIHGFAILWVDNVRLGTLGRLAFLEFVGGHR